MRKALTALAAAGLLCAGCTTPTQFGQSVVSSSAPSAHRASPTAHRRSTPTPHSTPQTSAASKTHPPSPRATAAPTTPPTPIQTIQTVACARPLNLSAIRNDTLDRLTGSAIPAKARTLIHSSDDRSYVAEVSGAMAARSGLDLRTGPTAQIVIVVNHGSWARDELPDQFKVDGPPHVTWWVEAYSADFPNNPTPASTGATTTTTQAAATAVSGEGDGCITP